MDIKTHILGWEREIEANPAVLALAIVGLLAAALIIAMFIDGFIQNRQKKKRKRG